MKTAGKHHAAGPKAVKVAKNDSNFSPVFNWLKPCSNYRMLTPHDILGAGQKIAKRLAAYEHRQQQIEMADAVANAIAKKRHLIVEAGTGVGKSFGYLVPAILSLAENQESKDEPKKRIVVSTHTISLQEQIINKDIPFLNSVIPLEFSAVLAKGRGNYVSLRRLKDAAAQGRTVFGSEQEFDQVPMLSKWAKETGDGSRSDLPIKVLPQVWDEVRSDSSNCLGRKCPQYSDCWYFKARNRLQNADVLVVNHALFFSDLSLRRLGVNILPDYHTVILDEAHTVVDVASDHLGISITMGQVEYTLKRLYNGSRNKGLLVVHGLGEIQRLVVRALQESQTFFNDVIGWSERNSSDRNSRSNSTRVTKPGIVQNKLSPLLVKISAAVEAAAEGVKEASGKQNLISASERLSAVSGAIESWRLQTLEGGVYWLEQSVNRAGKQLVSLMAAPIDVGPEIREHLLNKTDSVIMASATIATGGSSFDFFRNRVGMTQGDVLKLGSPFDYKRQSKLILVTNIANPSENRDLHQRQCVDAIKDYVARTDGHAFVLFTSYDSLRRTERDLTPWLSQHDYGIFSQASGTPRGQLLDQFKSTPRSVLFGTDSFWQGVDVQGDALQNVIITKLPFSVPDQPLLQARLDAIRESGGNPFNDYQVPEAVIKFKQGFGRLIRSKTDTGIVVVLDPRIKTKAYGKIFVQSLPETEIVLETI